VCLLSQLPVDSSEDTQSGLTKIKGEIRRREGCLIDEAVVRGETNVYNRKQARVRTRHTHPEFNALMGRISEWMIGIRQSIGDKKSLECTP
jgi:hypothetical protein